MRRRLDGKCERILDKRSGETHFLGAPTTDELELLFDGNGFKLTPASAAAIKRIGDALIVAGIPNYGP
jgi:hypothetical protein